ncbi:MazG-like family protein [Streptomyces sp. NPDC006307]|uniref:MazG-like family protein n=1 Tax=Streptomyces sp. NPDC006307 TaxID=3156748 RepID=UPI0033BDBB27
MKVETWDHVTRLRKWLDTDAAPTSVEDARLLRVLKISEELGEVAEALHGALGANPRKGASHSWSDVAKELADVIVTAMVALDTVSGDSAAVVENQLQDRTVEEPAAAGDIRLLQVLAISGDMGEVATAVYGALGTGPRGDAAEVTHTWEDVETCLGGLILTAAAALDDLTGDAWETVDERLRFLVERVAA